ncbi:hypoxanthine phosphoribosyltransferase [Paragonimus westermani]|uniref:Hypoxanthine phosphoribosyltransferase n=1 Tax=Paragonimus westermani TaxID=34504 RepID=A0A5J4NCR2_9TREM|nr:hypoxanthine phosphoribosyltransferase [Paragonimus westermani]
MAPRYESYVDHVLIPNGMVKDRIEKMALNIVTSFGNDKARSVTLLCVLKGGFRFLADLIHALESTIMARGTSLPMSMDFARIKSYVDILVVEDIIDTGKTMRYLLKYLESLSPRSVKVASLLLKRTPLSSGYKPDFTGFEIPDRFVVGYAFDYNDHFRDMHVSDSC